LGIGVVLGVFVAGFMAYFTFSFNPTTHSYWDGFGRPLSAAPWFMQFFFDVDARWAGWKWFLGDAAIFWTGLLGGGKLASWVLGKD
jgi:hypothetical protein